MLQAGVREDIKKGFLRIFPINHIWEAFELATGQALGCYELPMTRLPNINSALNRIHKRLEFLNDLKHDSTSDRIRKDGTNS
jgi:hypothetical protein